MCVARAVAAEDLPEPALATMHEDVVSGRVGKISKASNVVGNNSEALEEHKSARHSSNGPTIGLLFKKRYVSFFELLRRRPFQQLREHETTGKIQSASAK